MNKNKKEENVKHNKKSNMVMNKKEDAHTTKKNKINNTINKINILGIPIDNITMDEALNKVKDYLVQDGIHTIYTPNSEIMMEAIRDKSFENILKESDMLVADGAGVVLASKIIGHKLPERIAGFDLVKNILQYSSKTHLKIFLLGAKPGVAEEAAVNIINEFPGVQIVGWHHGYFNEEEEDKIIEKINSSKAQILLVALGAPKQEKWIHKNKDRFDNVRICIGVGGSLDVLAGTTSLAPPFFREHGLEWLYRLYKEPHRFWRMLDLPKFILLALRSKLHGEKGMATKD